MHKKIYIASIIFSQNSKEANEVSYSKKES